MWYEAFQEDSSCLIYISDWFVKSQQVNLWYEDYYGDDNYGVIIKWYEGYEKRKAQKAKRKEELMPSVWYSSGGIGACQKSRKKG